MSQDRHPALLAALILLYLVLAIWMARSQSIDSNEAWFASPAFTLIHKGYLGTGILESKGTWMQGIDRHTYWIPPLYPLLQALWYSLVGFGLMAMRSLSIAAGVVVLLAWYRIVSLLAGNRGVALLAIAIAATDTRFLTFAALGRPDIACAAFGAMGWAAYLTLRDRSLLRAILIGNSLTAASCLTHPCGELYATGLLGLMLYLDRRRIGWRNLALIGLPYVIALSAWGVYILQAPSDFARQLSGNVGGIASEFTGANRLAGLRSPLTALKKEYFLRYGFPFGWFGTGVADRIKIYALLIYTLGVAGCVLTPSIRKQRGCRALLLLGALNFLTLGIADAFKSSDYLVHTLPLAGGLLAIYAHFLCGHPRLFRAVAAIMILFGIVQLAAVGRNLLYTPERWDYEHALAFLRGAGSPPGIIAAGEFAFAFGFDSGMVDDWRLGYYSGKRPPFIAANDIYPGYYRQSAVSSHQIHQYLVRLLRDEYRVAFQNSSYTVYQRIAK